MTALDYIALLMGILLGVLSTYQLKDTWIFFMITEFIADVFYSIVRAHIDLR